MRSRSVETDEGLQVRKLDRTRVRRKSPEGFQQCFLSNARQVADLDLLAALSPELRHNSVDNRIKDLLRQLEGITF
jgi:hypothetical protein